MQQDYTSFQDTNLDDLTPGEQRRIELREDQLVVKKELREVGEIVIRTVTEEIPAQLEIETLHEHVEVEHEPVGETVTERRRAWEEDGDLIVPIYEEQVVVTKRLVLRERLRVRRINTPNRQVWNDTVRRERVVVEDPQQTGLVHEKDEAEQADGNVLRRIVSRALE